jgi:hypothetical protein
MTRCYRKFCKNISVISKPLTILLKKSVKCVWNIKHQTAFGKFKVVLKTSRILSAPDFDKCFQLALDASDIGACAVFIQEDNNGVDHRFVSLLIC